MALIEGCKHSIEVIVPVAEVEKETERAVAAIKEKVRLPGFRPGKAPLAMVKTRFASDIRQEVLEKLVPRSFNAAVEHDHLKVVGQPNVSEVHFHDGEPLRFKDEFEVAPDFELCDYQGLVVTYAEPNVTDEDVAAHLEGPLADGDYAVVSLESVSGVEQKVQQDELMLKIADEATMPAFTENLRGASPEESREFDVTYPEDYERETLKGRTVRFRATVKAVRRKELPEINDDFAKDLGDYQTLDELKNAIHKSILHEREHKAQDDAKHQLIEKLVDAHDFAVPTAYVDRQIETSLRNQLQTLAAQGIDPRSIKLDWEKVRESQKARATRDVQASLLLDKIADREAIGATQEEVDREVQRYARQQREAVAVVRAKLQKDGSLGRIAAQVRTDKTLSFLFDKARKEAPKEAPADTPQEPVSEA